MPVLLLRSLRCAAFVVLAGCSHAPPPPSPPVLVAAATVQRAGEASAPMIRYSAVVRPHRQVALSFRVGGSVQSILQVRDITGGTRTVQPGDAVASGAVLAQLGGDDYRAPLAAATDAAAAARANTSQALSHQLAAVAARRQAQDAVTEARTALAAARAQRAEALAGIGQADAAVQGAQADAALAQDTDRRTEALFATGSATLPQEQEARTADDAAAARLLAAQRARDAARGQRAAADAQIAACRARITEAQANVQAATATLAASASGVTAARAQAAQARATQAAQAVPLGDTTLRAPMAGVVLTRGVEVGSLTGPTAVAFVLADTSRLDVSFGVPETVAHRLPVGRHVTLTLGDRNEIALPGTITEVAPAANAETGVFDVQVTARNPAMLGKIGMVATVALPGASDRPDALTVPLSAVVQSRDQASGFAVVLILGQGGRDTAQRQDVEIGPTFGDRIVVRGLRAGQQIVASAPSQLYDGEPVQVTAPSDSGGDDGTP